MPEKIKILHILPSLTRAGAERVVYDLLSGINKEKFSTSLILFKDQGQGADWKKELVAEGVEIVDLKKRCLFDLLNFWQLLKTIKRLNPDIIHTHLGGDIYGRLAGRLAGVKIIVSTEHNLNYSEGFLATVFKRFTAPYAKQIFAVSEAVRQDAIRRYGFESDKTTVVYNGVDLKKFNAEIKSVEVGARSLVVGALGRLNQQKGFDILLQALSLVKHKNFLAKIAGEGEDKTALQKIIVELELGDKVELVGLVEPVDFISGLDLVVVPSRWEGLGLVALEAAALKKPIIASAVDGLKEIISEENGFTVAPGNPQILAEKIDYVLNNFAQPEICDKAAAAQATVREKFSLEAMIVNYSAWYEKLYENTAGK